MKARFILTAALAMLIALQSLATKSLAQDYVANVFTFGHSAGAGTVLANRTQWLAAFDGTSAPSGTGDVYKVVITRPGILKNLYWRAATSGLTGIVNSSITVFKQTPPAPTATATLLKAIWTGNTTSGNNTTATVSVNAGDLISVQLFLAPGGTNIARLTVSFEFLVAGSVASQWSTIGSDINYTTGKVGIGTTTPGKELEVTGTILADTVETLGGFRFQDGSLQTQAYIPASGGGIPENMLYADANGNIGVGTTSPGEKLTLAPESNIATLMATPKNVSAAALSTTSGTLLTGTGPYYYQIVAVDFAGGETVASQPEVPYTPTSGKRACRLTWDAITGAKEYHVYVKIPGDTQYRRLATTANIPFDHIIHTIPSTSSAPLITTAYVNKISAAEPSWIMGGNVGIGTTNPTTKLEVVGAISGFGIVPIGSIIAWHESLTGTPGLPDGWLRCNGQMVSDAASPFNGQVVPNLNGAVSGANSPGQNAQKQMFLRGGTTSGTGQEDAFQGHRHQVENSSGGGHYPGGPFQQTTGDNTYNGRVGAPITDGVNGTPRTANETRPINMSVVWIMRVK